MAHTDTKLPIKSDPSKSVSPAKTNGWPNFDSLRKEIESVFDRFGVGSWQMPFPSSSFDIDVNWPGQKTWGLSPAVDITERDKDYHISAELPGLDEKDVEIRLSNDMLTIKGEKKEEREEKDKDYFLSERRYGSFTRSFALPKHVDAEKIEASFSKGILTVKMPKTAAALKSEKKITIKSA